MAQKRLTIGRKAVAVAIIAELLDVAAERALELAGHDPSAQEVAEAIVTLAWDVEYKPNADRLVIVLDASFEAPQGPDAARSTPEDVPPRPCAYISNGKQCSRADGHQPPHVVPEDVTVIEDAGHNLG